MNKKIRLIIIICIIVTLSILIGGVFALYFKEDDVSYNIGDNTSYTAHIQLNGASRIGSSRIKCQYLNNGCVITLPSASRNNGQVLGFSDNKDDTEAKYFIGDRLTIDKDIELYVISYQENTLKIDGSDIDYLEKDSVSCRMYNANKSCKVTLPVYNKNGYENKGYSTSRESLVGFVYASDEYDISKDTLMYPIYSTSSRHQAIKISKTFTYLNSFIEVEDGCEESVYNTLLGYLDDISDKAPFLLLGNKITFLTDKTFNEVWGTNYVGMNYGPKSLRSVDVRCSSKVVNDYYATMVHEMAHSWDFYYAKKYTGTMSSQNDVINLYNKYKDQEPQIFREYSFSNLYEFVADMMRYYYFKYYVPKNPFIYLDYPNDTKKTLEKYICIANNSYDDKICK